MLLLFFCAVQLCGCAKCEEHVYSKPCDEYCKVCYEKRELPPGVEHNLTKWKSNYDYTCESDGTKYATCVYCGKGVVVVDVGSAPGHIYPENEWIHNNDNTHTEDGTESQLCYLAGVLIQAFCG